MPIAKSKAEMHDILRALLRESLRLQASGGNQPKLALAQGYVDGFVRALVESGLSDHKTLLEIVREVRGELGGPATRAVEAPASTLAA
ncbi:MAG TPA: hypothetical protein VGK73_00165 [Polyangiaceae bacterium]